MKIERLFTRTGKDPYSDIEFEKRTSEVRNLDGSLSNSVEITVPTHFSSGRPGIYSVKST